MAWRPERVQHHVGALFRPDGESLPSHPTQGSAPAAPMPVLPGLPRWPPLYPANCSSRSEGGPTAKALPGEKANGPEPLGPLRVLSKSPFSPTPYSLNSFPLNISGSSQRHFHPFHQTSQTSHFHRVLTHPSTNHWAPGGEKLASPKHILVPSAYLTSASDPKATSQEDLRG